MKLKRFDAGGYCFLVVFDPEKEEVRLGTLDPGSVKLDDLILVPKSTLAGLLATEQPLPTSCVPAGEDVECVQATKETSRMTEQIRQPLPLNRPVSGEESPVIPVSQPSSQAMIAQKKARREYRDDDLLNRSEGIA